uniref:Uncharacterized protein n=1 Tax=Lutzomyia longipalpis TaxID=7200 RepID=A0A1B0GJQ1_LUTLO
MCFGSGQWTENYCLPNDRHDTLKKLNGVREEAGCTLLKVQENPFGTLHHNYHFIRDRPGGDCCFGTH